MRPMLPFLPPHTLGCPRTALDACGRQIGFFRGKAPPAWTALDAIKLDCGTGRGNRTPTLLPELDFESSASTNSAIPAEGPQQ